MSQFSRFDAMLSGEMKDGAAVVNQKGRTITDPRPDLAANSTLWVTFLTLAAQESKQLFANLHGFRCAGTRLVKATSGQLAGMYVLRPDIDPTGDRAWESLDLYKEFKQKYLKPMETQLLKVLGELNKQAREAS